MTLGQYQILSKETATYPKSLAFEYTVLGLCGEAGELANKYKKVIRDCRGELTDEKKNEMSSELGDVLWYVAAIASELGVSLDDVADKNLNKLISRKERNVLGGSGDVR